MKQHLSFFVTTGKPLKSEIIGAEAGLDKPKNIGTEMTEDDWFGVRLPTLTGEDPFFLFLITSAEIF